MKYIYLTFLVGLFLNHICIGQSANIHYSISSEVLATSSGAVPFWMRSNQYGSIPLSGVSFSAIASVYKDYDTAHSRSFKWGFGINYRINAGKIIDGQLVEAYVKAKFHLFEVKGGRSKDIMGLTGDSTLSSGAFSISGNALGIPKVEISVPDYSYVLGGKLFSFKGNFAYGWLGEIPIQKDIVSAPPHPAKVPTYFHQKSFYIRLGRPQWRVKFYGGFNHQVFWGNEKKILGPAFTLSPLKTYEYVVLGLVYGNKGTQYSKIGNHLGSVDLGLDYNFANINISLSRQNFFDAGALGHLANILDGLNGITIRNLRKQTKKFNWEKLLFEILYTKNQAGEPWSKPTPSGAEDYYNNYEYSQGWSYNGLALGTPFISSINQTIGGFPFDPKDFFINNRVLLFHFGGDFNIDNWNFIVKLSYSKNYGTFSTSVEGRRTYNNITIPPQYGLFKEANQISTYFAAAKMLPHGLSLGVLAAVDKGKLLPNSFGCGIKLCKSF